MKKGHYLSIKCRDGKIERVFCPVHAPSLFEETCSLQEKNVSWDRLNYIDHRCFWPISWPYYLRFVQLIYYNHVCLALGFFLRLCRCWSKKLHQKTHSTKRFAAVWSTREVPWQDAILDLYDASGICVRGFLFLFWGNQK